MFPFIKKKILDWAWDHCLWSRRTGFCAGLSDYMLDKEYFECMEKFNKKSEERMEEKLTRSFIEDDIVEF